MLTVAQRLALSFIRLYCGQGDWVWLKKFETGAVHNLRQSSTSILRKVGTEYDGECGGKVARGTFAAAGCYYSPYLLFIHWITCHGCQWSCVMKSGEMDRAWLHLTNLPLTHASESAACKTHPGPAASKLVQCWMVNESSKRPCLQRGSGLEEITPVCIRAGWCTGSSFHVLLADSVAHSHAFLWEFFCVSS